MSHYKEDGELRDANIGKFGLNKIDSKGCQLKKIIRENDLIVANAFF